MRTVFDNGNAVFVSPIKQFLKPWVRDAILMDDENSPGGLRQDREGLQWLKTEHVTQADMYVCPELLVMNTSSFGSRPSRTNISFMAVRPLARNT